jgi:hypothetical protein
MSSPLIISASRRSDLPGFHAEACRKRILDKIRRLRTRHLYGVVFWTRHCQSFLEGGALHRLVQSEIDNPVVNLTITGLGGTRLEPGTPTTEEMLRSLPRLIRVFHEEPWRIRWRFDPLLKSHTSLVHFKQIAEQMADQGVRTCTFSFPAYFSLKGDLRPQFQAAGIPEWREDEKREIIDRLVDVAVPLGVHLSSCAQPENLELNPYIEEAQCIPREVLERGHPNHLPLLLDRDRSQRSKCRCIASDDIGDYETDRCAGGCVYCYSKAGGPRV